MVVDEVEPLAVAVAVRRVRVGGADVHGVGLHLPDPVDRGLVVNGAKRGLGGGIARREERDVVAAAHELFREPGDDALGPSIQPRRDALEQRGNLSDAHSCETIVQSRCRWHAHD